MSLMWSVCVAFVRRWARGWVLLAAILVLAGCQGKPSGTVTGKVTYKGSPVTSANVVFFARDKGLSASAKLDDSGAFTLSDRLDPGTYTVYIQPPPPPQLPPGTPIKKATVNIPKKYLDVAGSPLSKEVKPGKNEFSFELTN